MSHIEVSTEYHSLPAVESLDVAEESVLPLHAVVEAAQPVLGVGRIDCDEIECLILKGYDTPLMVMHRGFIIDNVSIHDRA